MKPLPLIAAMGLLVFSSAARAGNEARISDYLPCAKALSPDLYTGAYLGNDLILPAKRGKDLGFYLYDGAHAYFTKFPRPAQVVGAQSPNPEYLYYFERKREHAKSTYFTYDRPMNGDEFTPVLTPEESSAHAGRYRSVGGDVPDEAALKALTDELRVSVEQFHYGEPQSAPVKAALQTCVVSGGDPIFSAKVRARLEGRPTDSVKSDESGASSAAPAQ